MAGGEPEKEGVFARCADGDGAVDEALSMGDCDDWVFEGVRAVRRSSNMSGFSKSHGTPCLRQLPHLGWTSSHYQGDNVMSANRAIFCKGKRKRSMWRGDGTLILRDLQRLQPALDFLCDLLGGILATVEDVDDQTSEQ